MTWVELCQLSLLTNRRIENQIVTTQNTATISRDIKHFYKSGLNCVKRVLPNRSTENEIGTN